MNFLNIYFGTDKVYFVALKSSKKGLTLLDLGTTLDPVDIQLDDIEDQSGYKQLKRALLSIEQNIEELNIVLPNEAAIVSEFPGNHSKAEESKSLLELEVKQIYPQMDLSEFDNTLFEIQNQDKTTTILALSINKKLIERVQEVLDFTGLKINSTVLSQFSTIYSTNYNYPESKHLSIVNIGIEDDFVDISVSREYDILRYNILSYNGIDDALEKISSLLDEILNNGYLVSNIYLHGKGLSRNIISKLNNRYESVDVQRNNAFRLIKPNNGIPDRLKDYCFRTAHLFAPAIGALFLKYQNLEKL